MHSPHRVHGDDHTIVYPTATHMYEAQKYLPQHPEIADRIRLLKKVEDVYSVSAPFKQFERADWPQVFLTLVSTYTLFEE